VIVLTTRGAAGRWRPDRPERHPPPRPRLRHPPRTPRKKQRVEGHHRPGPRGPDPGRHRPVPHRDRGRGVDQRTRQGRCPP